VSAGILERYLLGATPPNSRLSALEIKAKLAKQLAGGEVWPDEAKNALGIK